MCHVVETKHDNFHDFEIRRNGETHLGILQKVT